VSDAPPPSPPEPAEAPAGKPVRKRTSLARRLVPIAVALVGTAVLGHLYGTQPVELLVRLPPGNEAITGLDLRVSREKGGAEVLRARRNKASREGRSVVVDTKLPRGKYLVEAWPTGGPASALVFEGTLAFDGEDALEVELHPR
jgi:hypothetical protein